MNGSGAAIDTELVYSVHKKMAKSISNINHWLQNMTYKILSL